MRFIVAERHDTPTIAVRMVVGAGSAEDPGGASGLAHLFQRIAFQGTETIGTRDGAAEKKALDSVEEAYERLSAERNKLPHPDEVKILSLQLEVQKALSQAQSYSSNDEFLHAFDTAGVTGLAADINTDFTRFQATVPSNKAEFWFLMESQWLLRPVFRNFYQERDRAIEDYRNAVESNPEARLLQALGAAAFTAHPYHHQPAGWLGDVAELRQSDARQFFDRYYTPGNITIAMAGDIVPEEARRLAERYFGSIAARAAPPAVRSHEPDANRAAHGRPGGGEPAVGSSRI